MHFFIKVIWWTNWPLFYKSETSFSKQFSLNIYLFNIFYSTSRMSKNMCLLRYKVRNGRWFVKISLRCRHAPTVGNDAFSHKIDWITIFFRKFLISKDIKIAWLVQELRQFRWGPTPPSFLKKMFSTLKSRMSRNV